MIGIFDSGVGGLISANEVSRLLPREDIIYLADRENAPYGTKRRDELIRLVKADIKRLRGFGAEKILIACCTASTIHSELTVSEREISIPIILPAAKAAVAEARNIAVISTLHTQASHAFRDAVNGIDPNAAVSEFALQELVALVEEGNRDGKITRECKELLDSFTEDKLPKGAEALILGCTHFSHLEGEFKKRLPHIKIISPAKEGAREIAKYYKENKIGRGHGRVIFA